MPLFMKASMPTDYRPVRRLVTGHDTEGRSVFLSDADAAVHMHLPGVPSFGVIDVWKLQRIPEVLVDRRETCEAPIQLAPPAGGCVLRVVEFPPDAAYVGQWNRDQAFSGMGESGSHAVAADSSRHEAMHKTESVDFAIVLEGEIWAVLDADERLMRTGDILIQQGTNHAWSNRSATPARVAFVLTAAKA